MSGFPVTNGVTTVVPPPEGYVVDFDNPQQRMLLQHYLVFGIGGPLALIALCQRYYTKIWLSKGLQIDDGEPDREASLPGKCVLLTTFSSLHASGVGELSAVVSANRGRWLTVVNIGFLSRDAGTACW